MNNHCGYCHGDMSNDCKYGAPKLHKIPEVRLEYKATISMEDVVVCGGGRSLSYVLDTPDNSIEIELSSRDQAHAHKAFRALINKPIRVLIEETA